MPSITRGEHVELLGVLVLGEVVLARVRAEHLGRHLVGLGDQPLNFLGISRLIIRPSQRSLHQAGRAQVAVPALDRVLLDVAVAAEQLDAVGADRHAALGAQPAGQRHLAGEASPWSTRAAAR